MLATLLALSAAETRAQAPAAPPAAPPGDTTAPRVREARALYERGVRHFHLAEYDAAIDAFKAAYRTSEAPGFLYNIALAYRMKGDCAQALHFYRMYLRLDPGAANRPEVEARIEEQRRCAAASRATSRPAPASQAAAGPARVGSRLEARGSSPQAQASGLEPRADPRPGPSAPRPAPRPAPRRLKLVLGLTTAVVGVALVATAGYYGAKARSDASTIDDLFQQGGQWNAHYRSVEADGRRASSLAIGLSIAGGVAILGGAALAYLDWRERRVRPVVLLGGRVAALSVSCDY